MSIESYIFDHKHFTKLNQREIFHIVWSGQTPTVTSQWHLIYFIVRKFYRTHSYKTKEILLKILWSFRRRRKILICLFQIMFVILLLGRNEFLIDEHCLTHELWQCIKENALVGLKCLKYGCKWVYKREREIKIK